MDLLLDLNELNKYFGFDHLVFKDKLQLLCDIVRQSIYPNGHPNPDMDVEDLNGNCYTSSFVFLNYIKKLNIGLNPRCELVRKRCFDLEEITSIHIVVFVESDDGHVFQVDTTPFAGYKYGSVEDITYKKIYDDCVPIDEDIKAYLYIFRKIIYDNANNRFDNRKIYEYLDLCKIIYDYPILKGYVAMVLKIIRDHLSNKYEKDRIQSIINAIKPYNSKNPDKIMELRNRFTIELGKWYDEFNDLKDSGKDEKRMLELGINIVQEGKWFDKTLNRFTYINGRKVNLSSINPRFLYENDYKAFFAKSKDLDRIDDCVARYRVSLSHLKSQLGLDVLSFSNLSGVLLDDDIYVALFKRNVTLSDCLHESSSYVDSSLDYLFLYPEHQVMTKFMNKNPKLLRKLINNY